MSARLPSYLRRRVGIQILALLAVLTAMMQLLELLDVTTEILQRGQGVGGLAYYALLRTPAELLLSLPLAVLLGAATSLHAMARGNEITAMRASGVGMMRLFCWFLPLLLLLASVQLALLQTAVPRAEAELKRWWKANTPANEQSTPLWVSTRSGTVSIDTISPDGRELRGVRIYSRHAGLLVARVRAAGAEWTGRGWQLRDVSELRLEADGPRRLHEDAREWQTNLHPDEVLRLDLVRPQLSSMMLADVIAGSRVGSQPLSYYQTALYRSFAAPFGVFVMLLLALPTAAMQPRYSGGGREMLMALVLGLGFLLFDGIVASLGSSGQLPPLPTALAAPLLFAVIGLLRLWKCERL